MKIVVFAKGERAPICLQAMLQSGFRPEAVFAENADPQVVAWANAEKVALLSAPEDLLKMTADVLVLAGYTRILREPLLSHARLGTLNLHGGKLPEYRGASVLNWQIINGETEGGVSIIFADQGIDTGDIVAQARFPITPTDTFREVSAKAFSLFPKLLVDVLKHIEGGAIQRKKQNPLDGAYYHKRKPEDGIINWERESAERIHNLVRALTRPCPGAFTFLHGKKISIWATRLMPEAYQGLAGRIVRLCPDGVIVMAQDRGLVITDFTVEDLDAGQSREFFKQHIGWDFEGRS